MLSFIAYQLVVVMVNMINLTASRATWETRFWACLWKVIYIHSTEAGRSAFTVRDIVLRDRVLDRLEKTSWAQVFIATSFPTADAMWPLRSSACHHGHDFFITMDCTVELWNKINSPFLKLFSLGHFVTGTTQATTAVLFCCMSRNSTIIAA